MELPVVECVEWCFGVVQKIAVAVETVKSFKKRTTTLQKRIKSLVEPTRLLYEEDPKLLQNQPTVYKHALIELRKCLNDIEIFALKLSCLGKIQIFLKNQEIKESFDEFNSRLTDLSSDLQLGVNVVSKTLVSKLYAETVNERRRQREDKKDERSDLQEMLVYITTLETSLDMAGMSDKNKIYVEQMFSYIKSKGARIRDLEVDEGEDMSDCDDEPELHIPATNLDVPQVVYTIELDEADFDDDDATGSADAGHSGDGDNDAAVIANLKVLQKVALVKKDSELVNLLNEGVAIKTSA